MQKACYHFDSVKASIESVLLDSIEPDRVGQHDRGDRQADDDGGHHQRRRYRIDDAGRRLGRTQRAVDDRRGAVGDIADRHNDDMNAGVDQREADDDAQDVAVSEHAPKSDQDEDEACRQNDVRDRQMDHPPLQCDSVQPRNRSMMTLSSQPTLMPSRTEMIGNGARAEEGTELAERKHPVVQKSARENQPRDADQNKQARPPAIP